MWQNVRITVKTWENHSCYKYNNNSYFVFVIYGCLKSGVHRNPLGCDTVSCRLLVVGLPSFSFIFSSLIRLRTGDSAKLCHLKSSLVVLSICLGSLPSWPMKCAPIRFYAFESMCTNTTLLYNSCFCGCGTSTGSHACPNHNLALVVLFCVMGFVCVLHPQRLEPEVSSWSLTKKHVCLNPAQQSWITLQP